MLVDIIINNYNYKNYVSDAIDSVINQTYDRINSIIIVDDGSTDGSVDFIRNNYENIKNIIVLEKAHGGQLSTFNYAVKKLRGELVFFLDADDIYKDNYIEKAVEFYRKHEDCDFLFCAIEKFGNVNEIVRKFNTDIDFGFSVLRTLLNKEWIGATTSTISMKREIFEKIVPIPYVKDWITRADDCLVWGASLAGARKYYLNEPLVKYRVHNLNNFHMKKFNQSYIFKRELAIEKLFTYFSNRFGYSENIYLLLWDEFNSIKEPTIRDLKSYIRILIKIEMSFIHKIFNLFKILFRYCRMYLRYYLR